MGQFYTQSLNTLYILNSVEASIMVYNLATNSLDPSSTYIGTIPHGQYDGIDGCIASTAEILYVISGNNPTTLKIFSFDDPLWITGPSLTTPRRGASCILSSNIPDINQKLYVIGGTNIDTVEYVSTYRIIFDNNQFNTLSTTLSAGLSSTRAVLFNDIIYVIGGIISGGGSGSQSNKMHLIDINTNTVSLSSDKLAVGVWGAGVILVDNTIYAFGGQSNVTWLNTWQTYQMYVLPFIY